MTYTLPALKFVATAGIAVVVLGCLMLLGILRGRQSPLSYMLGGAVCIAIGLWVYHLRTPGRVTVDDGKLVIKVPMYRERVVTGEIVERAWTEQLGPESPWRPVKKKSGTATRTVCSGHFELANKRKAFVLIEGKRVLCIETKQGELYQVGIPDFERLVRLFSEQVHPVGLEFDVLRPEGSAAQ